MTSVAVIGGGLAGLACARALSDADVRVTVLQADDRIGGRVATDRQDGFLLDRGFQVLLSAYPTTRSLVELDSLRPRAFTSGAIAFRNGQLHRIAHPIRHPLQAPAALFSSLATTGDIAALARLVRRARGPLHDLLSAPELTTERALHEAGVSEDLLEGFFRPFFGGVFLDRELTTTSRMFDFLFRMFAQRPAVVPELGMSQLPRVLAAPLPQGTIRLGAKVQRIGRESLELATGDQVAADAVVIATDGSNASVLHDSILEPVWRQSTTIYYAAEEPPTSEPILFLSGERRALVNSAAVMSNVSPAYADSGRALISASIIGEIPDDREPLERRALADLRHFFGPAAAKLEHLRTYHIARALPAQPVGGLVPPAQPARLDTRLYVCGDHREHASIEGAIASGLRAAHACLHDLDAPRHPAPQRALARRRFTP